MDADTDARLKAIESSIVVMGDALKSFVRQVGAGPDAESVHKLELAAMRQVIVAARRVRMLKGAADSMVQLANALEQYDELLEDKPIERKGPG